MKHLVMIGSVLALAAGVMSAVAAAPLPGSDSRGTARVEREDSGAGPAPVLVFGSTTDPAWGAPGAVVYGAWQPGDPAVVFYPPRCVGCPSVCAARSCFAAVVAVRAVDTVPGHALTLLRLPDTLPGTPGAGVKLHANRDGSWSWVNP